MPDSPAEEKRDRSLTKSKNPLLDDNDIRPAVGLDASVNRSVVHSQRLACQILGVWVILGWLLSRQLLPFSFSPGAQEWFDAWGRWGLGGHWYIAIPLGILLIWQGSRPRFYQGSVMLVSAILILMPAVIAHLIPGVEMGLLILAGFALIVAAQSWPLVDRLGTSSYKAPEKE